MSEWVREWVNEWMSEWMHWWMDDWMDEGMGKWMKGWMNQWMDGWKCNLDVKNCNLDVKNGRMKQKMARTGRRTVRPPGIVRFPQWFMAKIEALDSMSSGLGGHFGVTFGVTLHTLGWLRRHLGYFWGLPWMTLVRFQKNMFLSISMMSCNFTVKLGRIQKDSDGSERRVCIRVSI